MKLPPKRRFVKKLQWVRTLSTHAIAVFCQSRRFDGSLTRPFEGLLAPRAPSIGHITDRRDSPALMLKKKFRPQTRTLTLHPPNKTPSLPFGRVKLPLMVRLQAGARTYIIQTSICAVARQQPRFNLKEKIVLKHTLTRHRPTNSQFPVWARQTAPNGSASGWRADVHYTD